MNSQLRLFSTNADVDFAQRVASHLKVDLHLPTEADEQGKMIQWFSNGNVLVDIKVHVRGLPCFVFVTQTPNVSDHIIELFWLVNALKTSKAKSVTAVMPYMPYIRSDKKDHPRACVGAKLFLNLLETAGVSGILIMDPHFQQIHGFVDEERVNADVLWAKPIFVRHIRENFDSGNAIIVAPDVGEGKHATSMANRLGLKFAIIDKRRVDDSENAVPSSMVGDVSGRDCFIFDDETASGGTLIQAADFCVLHGARSVNAFISHPVLSNMGGVKRMSESTSLTRLTVTNTIPIPADVKECLKGKLTVLDVSGIFAGAIEVIYRGQSLDRYKQSLYE